MQKVCVCVCVLRSSGQDLHQCQVFVVGEFHRNLREVVTIEIPGGDGDMETERERELGHLSM